MELINWHLDLSLKCEARGDLCVSLRLSVECSVCRMIYKLTTDYHVLRGDIQREAIHETVDDAFTARPCVHCGVLQTLSEHDKGKLRKDMEALLTDAWAKAQYHKPAA
jgi:hypothetical protein